MDFEPIISDHRTCVYYRDTIIDSLLYPEGSAKRLESFPVSPGKAGFVTLPRTNPPFSSAI